MHYTERFLRTAKKLPHNILDDALHAIDQLEHPSERAPLHVYPLEGRLRGLSSLAINYEYQAIVITNDSGVVFLDIAHR